MQTKKYFEDICSLLKNTSVSSDSGKFVEFDLAFDMVNVAISRIKDKKNKLIFIGNGGSASIASHMAADFLKNGGISALAFNDSSLLTCLSNDLGYESVFSKPIEMLARSGDMLMAISSSGRSKNILQAVEAAKKSSCYVITLSGFTSDNPLRGMGDLNFYIDSASYGYVEISHSVICHCLLDAVIENK